MTINEEIEDRGLRRVAGAVLLQAIEDLCYGNGSKRAGVLRWMEDPTEETFGFAFWCKVANRHPDEIRRALRRRITASLFSNPVGRAA